MLLRRQILGGNTLILQVENLTKLYKNGRGIEDISFTVDRDEVLGMLGPNGSGKTTTMKAICGLVGNHCGNVTVCGENAFLHHERAMRKTGSLIEAPALFDHMSAFKNLKMASRFFDEVDDTRIREVLALCGMEKYEKDKCGTFSLGMRQRIGLALALLSKPQLLILDEPANGLDIEGMVQIREIVTQMAKSGCAVLISSHLAHEIELCATRVLIIYDGQMRAMDTMESILSEYPSLEDYFLMTVSGIREEVTI